MGKRHVAVPFTRVLRRGKTRGADVHAVKRALVRAGFLHQKLKIVTPFYRRATERAVKRFQRTHHLPVTGVYNRDTHSMLVKARGFDAYGAKLMMESSGKSKGERLRKKVVAAALFELHHAPQHYVQRRPMLSIIHRIFPPKFPGRTGMDCSECATLCYRIAGAPDPNGLGYNGEGYTGTIAAHAKKHVKLADAREADLPLYGSAPRYEHVTICVGHGKCVSDGMDGGPFLWPVNYRDDLSTITRHIP